MTLETRQEAQAALSPIAPLRRPTYRMLWAVWLSANVCMWMNDVAAAWMMTSLNATPLWVALVQTASNLPVFLLGLPSGALADSIDRRRYFLGTQLWVAAVAVALSGAVLCGWLNAPLLLALTFANGIGLALRWPVFAAIVPGLVPRAELPAALALNGVAMNASRIFGPLAAGAIIASCGTAWVFVLNALLSAGCALSIQCWRYQRTPASLAREPLGQAIRVGLQFLGQSERLRTVLLRSEVFFFHTSALLALLPLAARRVAGADAGGYTVLLATMGSGAICAAMSLPRLRQLLPRERLIIAGGMAQAVSTLGVALAPNLWCAALAMALEGAAWITTANSLSVWAQLGLPDWVRARGMSMYQMAIMGSGAIGAVVWGRIAGLTDVSTAMVAASATGAAAAAIVGRLVAARWSAHGIEEDFTPSRALQPAPLEFPPGRQVVITIEYRIDPRHAPAFLEVMQESQRSRLRRGALRWRLLEDAEATGCYVEEIVDASWTEHRRRFDRLSASDVALRERKLSFHIGSSAPIVRRYAVHDA